MTGSPPQLGGTRPVADSGPLSDTRPEKKPRLTASEPKNVGRKSSKKSSARKGKKRQNLPEAYSPDDVLWRDVIDLLGKDVVEAALEEGLEWESPFGFREQVEVDVKSLSSAGTSLALAPHPHKPWAVITPFALPGEKIRVRVYRNSRLHSYADLINVTQPNPALRDMTRVRCRYFGECAGCQYQMLSYESQLDLKRNVVVKAYHNFSELPALSLPEIGPTIPSPLQYGYRTKITPHFEAPPRKSRDNPTAGSEKPEWLKIGFNKIGGSHVMDIEECPIAMPVLNEALGPMRENIIKNIYTYKKGVSLLLRDSLQIATPTDAPGADETNAPSGSIERHVCITDHKATVRERVGDMLFEYPGGSFFQNNNSVLVPLINHVRDAIFATSDLPEATSGINAENNRPTHLVDAYCGSGLFSITLSPFFETIAGIELSIDSIKSAKANAGLNGIPESKCTFYAGDASNIFSAVSQFPPDKTVLIIDPPRKGCDENFLEQLVRFRCARVVYVSCNVHTQARDIGTILKRTESEDGGKGKYVLESLRGVDLFPQTAHVESVAVLKLI